MKRAAPRLLIAAPGSGSGKTTVACALLRAFSKRLEHVNAFKCGPDYIDTMFHTEAVGVDSRNLDLFMLDAETVRWLLLKNSRPDGLSVMEGAMGYYDGVGGRERASSYDVARETKTPAVLVADCRGKALSLAAELKGFAGFRQDSFVKGVLLNRLKPALYPKMKEMVEREAGLKVYGYLPPLPEASLESRHLGLVTAAETAGLQQKLHLLAEQAERTVDLDGLVRLAREAPELSADAPALPEPIAGRGKIRIAVAKDKAFCFYYEDSLELLRELGAELVPFSPLCDQALPGECRGILLGGGYPELYAEELSGNAGMRRSVKTALENGTPCVAECGGFQYLQGSLQDQAGRAYPMAGVIDSQSYPAGALRRFGYVTLTAKRDNLLCRAGESIPAHEFHYWDSTDCGGDFRAQKPGGRAWDCAFSTETLYAGYPHFHFYSNPGTAWNFLKKCSEYRG